MRGSWSCGQNSLWLFHIYGGWNEGFWLAKLFTWRAVNILLEELKIWIFDVNISVFAHFYWGCGSFFCCSLLMFVFHTDLWSMIHCSPATCFLFCTTTWIIITSKYNCHTTPHIQQNRKSSNPTVRRAFFVPRILVIPVLRPLVHMFTPLPIVPTVKWCLNNVSHKVF